MTYLNPQQACQHGRNLFMNLIRSILLLTLLPTILGACAGPAWPSLLLPLSRVLPALRDAPLSVIAFGSCANQSKPQPIWDAVVASRPDLFVFLGDNIYADTEDMAVMRARYRQLGDNPNYQRLATRIPIIATWDDHDYGANDAGVEYPKKAESKQIFLDFFGEPANSKRRQQEGGIYTAYAYGPVDQRIQIILLDTRWDRSPLTSVSESEYAQRRLLRIGPYTANSAPDARLLGEAQWRWLEEQLRQPAEVRILATSIPFLQEGTGWETWSNFPTEQKRLQIGRAHV